MQAIDDDSLIEFQGKAHQKKSHKISGIWTKYTKLRAK